MIFFFISFAITLFILSIFSLLLKLNLFTWNNLWGEEDFEIQLSIIQFTTFLSFLIFFILSLLFFPFKEKYVYLSLIIFLFSAFFYIFISEEKAFKILLKFKIIFILIGKIIPFQKAKKTEEIEEASENEIKAYIDIGKEQGILEEKETIMLENILDFSETLVKEIMTPRADMVVISIDSSYKEIRETFVESNFSRLPVIENSLDNIKGILFLKDFFKIENENNFDIKKILKKAHFVPEAKKVPDLLKEMQDKHLTISIVLDEYGGTQGLVTMEDLLEELIGEIEDEHAIPDIIKMSKDTFSIAGKTHIEEVEDFIKIKFEKGDYDTLAGFLIYLFGTIPEENQEIAYKGFNFKIETADKRRIYRVLVKKYEE